MRQDVIAQVIFSAHWKPTAIDEAINANSIVWHRNVTSEVIGGEETFLAEMTHVISLTEVDFLVDERKFYMENVEFILFFTSWLARRSFEIKPFRHPSNAHLNSGSWWCFMWVRRLLVLEYFFPQIWEIFWSRKLQIYYFIILYSLRRNVLTCQRIPACASSVCELSVLLAWRNVWDTNHMHGPSRCYESAWYES